MLPNANEEASVPACHPGTPDHVYFRKTVHDTARSHTQK